MGFNRRLSVVTGIIGSISAAKSSVVAPSGVAVVQSNTGLIGIDMSAVTDGNFALLTISPPSGMVVGDLLIAAVNSDNGAGSISPYPGWISLVGSLNAQLQYELYYRVVTSNEPIDYRWDITKDAAGDSATGGIMRIDNFDTGSPFDIFASSTGNGNSDTVTAPAVTASIAPALRLRFGAVTNNSTITAPIVIWDESAILLGVNAHNSASYDSATTVTVPSMVFDSFPIDVTDWIAMTVVTSPAQ